MKLQFKKVSKNCYNIICNKKVIGDLDRDVDGYFYFWFKEDSIGKSFPSWILKEIYLKLEELNTNWDSHVDKFLNNSHKQMSKIHDFS